MEAESLIVNVRWDADGNANVFFRFRSKLSWWETLSGGIAIQVISSEWVCSSRSYSNNLNKLNKHLNN